MSAYDTYLELKAIVAKHRPELADEFPPATSDFHQMGTFLTKHFPREDGWWARSCMNGPADLRYMLEGV